MRYTSAIPVVLLALTSVTAFADAFVCKPITGTIEQLTIDPDCKILKDKARYFPDVTFYGALGTCFSGKLQGSLGGKSVIGTTFSGFTANGIGQLTAASSIRLTTGSREIGRVFTKDLVSDPEGNATELVTMVSGTKQFKGGYGSLEISGNGIYQATTFSGVVCMQD